DLSGVLRGQLLDVDQLQIATALEPAVLVVDVGDPAAHPGGEVATGRAEHHDAPAGHVLAAVIAEPFDHRGRPRVAHREPLTRQAAKEGPARGGAVQHRVADD